MFFKKTYKRKIYRTTDGYLDNKPHIKKPRHVVVVDQRDDGAIAVSKIHSVGEKNQNVAVKNLILKPKKNRLTITEESFVENKVFISRKITKGDKVNYELFYPRNFRETGEKLSIIEFAKLKHNLQNDNKHQKETHKIKISKWKNHFK